MADFPMALGAWPPSPNVVGGLCGAKTSADLKGASNDRLKTPATRHGDNMQLAIASLFSFTIHQRLIMPDDNAPLMDLQMEQHVKDPRPDP